jgi:hypothetical protein
LRPWAERRIASAKFSPFRHIGLIIPPQTCLLAVRLSEGLRCQASGKCRCGECHCETQSNEHRSKLLQDSLLSCAPPIWLLEQRQKLASVQLGVHEAGRREDVTSTIPNARKFQVKNRYWNGYVLAPGQVQSCPTRLRRRRRPQFTAHDLGELLCRPSIGLCTNV